MKHIRLRQLLFFLALAPSGVVGQTAVTGTAELAFKTGYLFAGIPFAEDEVTQATVSVGVGSLTFNAFSSYDHMMSDVTEGDVYADYYKQVSPAVGVFVGAALYSFKIGGTWESTPEVYSGIVFAAPLTPTLYVAHDFDLGDGTHALLTLTHDVPLGSSGATLGLTGNLDYNSHYYVETSGFSYADLGLSVGIPLGSLTLSPTFVLQRGIEDGFIDDEVFGIRALYAF